MNQYHVQIIEPFMFSFDTHGNTVDDVFNRIEKDNYKSLFVRIWDNGPIGTVRQIGGSWALEKWTTPPEVYFA